MSDFDDDDFYEDDDDDNGDWEDGQSVGSAGSSRFPLPGYLAKIDNDELVALIDKMKLGETVSIDPKEAISTAALFAAAVIGDTGMVSMLLDAGVDKDLVVAGESALSLAISNERNDAARLLISRGVGRSIPPSDEGSIAHYLAVAIRAENADIMRLLIDNNASVVNVEYSGNVPLHAAIKTGNPAILAELLRVSSVKLDALHANRTPLAAAIASRKYGLARSLIERGASVARALACFAGEFKGVFDYCKGDTVGEELSILLIKNGANVLDCGRVPTPSQVDTAVAYATAATAVDLAFAACCLGRGAAVDVLVRKFPAVQAWARTPAALYTAVHCENDDALKALLEVGVPDPTGAIVWSRRLRTRKTNSVASDDSDKETVQSDTTVEEDKEPGGDVAVAECNDGLLERIFAMTGNGNRLGRRTACYETALHAACAANYVNGVAALIAGGANASARDSAGMTPLHVHSCERNPFQQPRSVSDVDVIGLLVGAGADVNARDLKGRTPLHYAVTLRPEIVQRLLFFSADLHARDTSERTPLLSALRPAPVMVTLNTILALLEAGADPNARDAKDRTPLHLAAVNSQDSDGAILTGLIECGVQVDALDAKGRTPLACLNSANRHRKHGAISVLVQAGARLDVLPPKILWGAYFAKPTSQCLAALVRAGLLNIDWDGCTVMHAAMSARRLDVVTDLIAAGAPIDTPSSIALKSPLPSCAAQSTPLHVAVTISPRSGFGVGSSGREALIIKALINAGVDMQARDANGQTPLDIALMHSKGEAVHILVDGEMARAKHPRDLTPTAVAWCATSDAIRLRQMLELGVSANMVVDGASLLHYACVSPTGAESMQVLLERGADFSAVDNNGHSPLDYIFGTGDSVQRVLYVFSPGRNLQNLMSTQEGRKLLCATVDAHPHLAKQRIMYPAVQHARNGGVEFMRALLRAGLAVNFAIPHASINGQTALHATCHGNFEGLKMLRCLLDAGADPNAVCANGLTPLHYLATARFQSKEESVGALQLLVERGANMKALNRQGDSFWELAASHSSLSGWINIACDKLGLDAAGIDGNTLMSLVYGVGASREAIERLLSAGVSMDIKGSNGESPVYLYSQHGSDVEVLRLLIERGAGAAEKDTKGRTALHMCVLNRNCRDAPAFITAVLAAGVDPAIADSMGRTAYDTAVLEGNRLCATHLVSVGANVSADATAIAAHARQLDMVAACRNGDVRLVESLLTGGKAALLRKCHVDGYSVSPFFLLIDSVGAEDALAVVEMAATVAATAFA